VLLVVVVLIVAVVVVIVVVLIPKNDNILISGESDCNTMLANDCKNLTSICSRSLITSSEYDFDFSRYFRCNDGKLLYALVLCKLSYIDTNSEYRFSILHIRKPFFMKK